MVDVKTVDVQLDDYQALTDFQQFYATVFIRDFLPNEINTFQEYLDLKRQSLKTDGFHEYHIVLLYVNHVVAGVHIYNYFPTLRSVILEFCCIRPEFRRKGYASALFAYPGTISPVDWTFLEVERDNQRNLVCWGKNGVKRIMFDYVQPSLGPDRPPCDNLFFCVKSRLSCISMPSQLVEEIVKLYYTHAMGYDTAESLPEFIAIANQLSSNDSIQLEDLT